MHTELAQEALRIQLLPFGVPAFRQNEPPAPCLDEIEPCRAIDGDFWADVFSCCMQGNIACLQGDPSEARRCYAAAWRLIRYGRAVAAPPNWVLDMIYASLMRSYTAWSDWRRSLRYARIVLKRSLSAGNLKGSAAAYTTIGEAYLQLGEWEQAQDYFEKGLAAARQAAADVLADAALLGLACLLIEQGRWSEDLPLAQQVRSLMEGQTESFFQLEAFLLAGRLARENGHHQEALHLYQRLDSDFLDDLPLTNRLTILSALAEAHLITGDLARAEEIVREGARQAASGRAQREYAALLRIYGEALLQRRKNVAAGTALLSAEEITRKIDCPLDHAKTLSALADLYFVEGKTRKAQQTAQRSIAIFENIGALPAAERARKRFKHQPGA